MTFIVHGAAGSGSVPVEAVLTLAGAPFRVIETPTWEGEAERDRVAATNPMRQIPALITPEGETLTESAAILIWLTERFPELGLAPPPGDPRRGQFLRWMTFVSASIYALYWVRDEPDRLVGADASAQAQILSRTADRISHCWSVMERQIEPGLFLLGERMTVLDLYVAVISRWRPLRPRFHEVAPRMGAVVRQVDALQELQDFWARRFPFEGDYADPA